MLLKRVLFDLTMPNPDLQEEQVLDVVQLAQPVGQSKHFLKVPTLELNVDKGQVAVQFPW